MEIWKGKGLPREIPERKQEGLIFLAAGSGLLATTFLASRGNNHSRIHKNVLAPIALGAEAATLASGIRLMAMEDNDSGDYLSKAGRIALGTTLACHVAVVLTDIHIVNHLRSGKGLSGPDLFNLGEKFFTDFKRHMRIR